jgi:RNA polymerase sigma factor (sigma-70 family)
LNLEQLRDPARFGAWLCSIAINLARTQRSAAFPARLSWETLNDKAGDDPGWPDPNQPLPEAEVIRQELIHRVRQVVADLPPAEREAVMLVYLNELSHQEAATRLGSSLSAVKVRVHRGRRRLRTALHGEFTSILTQQFKERDMIKVDVHDVMICIKPEHIPSEVEEVNLTKIFGAFRAVLLKEQSGDRAIAIWIGPFEADSIVVQLRQLETKRPLTYELIKTLLDIGHVVVERMVLSRLHEETFFSNLVVRTDSTVSEVDCRPSDAINLALRLDVPMFVDAELMDQLNFTPDTDGNYSWAKYDGTRLRQAAETAGQESAAERQEWIWLSALALDHEQLAQGYIQIGDRTLPLDAESKATQAKLAGVLK